MLVHLKERTVVSLALEKCPPGKILDEKAPNDGVDNFFKGWANPLGQSHGMPSLLEVIREGDEGVIIHRLVDAGEKFHRYGCDRYLVGGEQYMTDYCVEADVALDSYLTTQSADNSMHVRAMSGVFGRFEDCRHYYYFCLEGIGNASCVLYCRMDDMWKELARRPLTIKTGRYYKLAVQFSGSAITCFIQNEQLFTVNDYTFKKGQYGFRFSTAGRVKNFGVFMSDGQWSRNEKSRVAYEEEIGALQASNPKMVLWRRLDFTKYNPFTYDVVTLPDGKSGFLIKGKTVTALSDLDGKIIWERPMFGYFPVITAPYKGSFDITGVVDGKLTSLDGATGSIRRQVEFDALHNASISQDYNFSGWPPTAVNLRGTPTARDIIVKANNCPAGSGSVIWAYDEDLSLMWRAEDIYPLYGHLYSFAFMDINDDGREEIFPGASCYSPDGELLWQTEDAADMANIHDALHVDSNVIGNFSGDRTLDPMLFCSVGSAGVYAINARTGKTVANHRVGHAQAIYAGSYLPEEGGLTVCSATRWNNYGILTMYNGRGDRLSSFQPDYTTEGGPAVNWTGDGRELMLICSGTDVMGLYDGYGRRAVIFPKEVMEYFHKPSGRYAPQIFAKPVQGDPRDEIMFNIDGFIHIYTQDNVIDTKKPVFAPIRRLQVSEPSWTKGDADR